MKKAFTLVELLVVVVVIVTLLGITFRLAGVGSDSTARNITVNRLQRLENCLSGYYAAYGSYPPVKLHGTRDYTLKVDAHGLQDGDKTWSGNLKDNWKSVETACKSQPIGMTYPFNKDSAKEYVQVLSDMLTEQNPGNPLYQFEALCNNGTVSGLEKKKNWSQNQIFRFGVLSYLLPRYLIIMGDDADAQIFTNHEMWKTNNQLPPDFDTGVPFASWKNVNERMKKEPWKIAALPSQATCARWLPNLEKQLTTMQSTVVYGIELRDSDSTATTPLFVYSASGSVDGGQNFFPDRITIKDGWGSEFFYYSLPPHQHYRLWSAGKNERTFPPWVTDEEVNALSSDDRQTVQAWVADDIVQMSN